MSRHAIIDCQPCHIRALVPLMRAADAEEVLAVGMLPMRAVWNSWKGSLMSKAAFVDGDVAAAWGVCGRIMDEVGVPWLVTTAAVERVPLTTVRVGRQATDEMQRLFPRLENYVHAPYERAIRFLRILGFTVEPPQPLGPAGALFCRLHRSA